MTDATRAERIINAMPWEPPPGYAKRKCTDCRFWFSTPSAANVACVSGLASFSSMDATLPSSS